MARVPFDHLAVLLAADPTPVLPPVSAPEAGGGESFDRHLQRARESAEQDRPPALTDDPSSDAAADRGSSPPAAEPISSGVPNAAGEEQSERAAESAEEKRRDRTPDEGRQDGTASAAVPAEVSAAAPHNDTTGHEVHGEACSSHEGKASAAPNPAKGKAKASLAQSAGGEASPPTESGQRAPLTASAPLLRETAAEQPGGGPQDETPGGPATKTRPAKVPAKRKTENAVGVEGPTAEADPAAASAGESASAAAETPGLSGLTLPPTTTPKPQPAVGEAQAAATAPRRGGSRSAAKAVGEAGSAAEDGPAGAESGRATATPEKPGDSRQPALPTGVAAAIDPEPERARTPDAKGDGGSVRIDSQAGKETSPRPTATPSADAQTTAGGEQADRVRFVQRVARAFEAAADRGGPIRLRLHPPELGALRLELTIRHGAVTARIQAETEAAQNMLLDHLAELRQRLAEHQLRVERFDVEWTGRSPGDPLRQSGGHFPGPARQGSPAPRTGAAAERQGAVPSASPPRGRTVHPGSFDVII